MVPDVVIKVAGLPEWHRAGRSLSPFPGLNRNFGLQYLHCASEPLVCGFADQEMHVLGHDHKSEDIHVKAPPGLLKCRKEDLLHVHCLQEGQTMIATEGEEVCLARMMEAFKA